MLHRRRFIRRLYRVGDPAPNLDGPDTGCDVLRDRADVARRELIAQERVSAALRDADVRAPQGLRRRVQAMALAPPTARLRGQVVLPRSARLLRLGGGLAGATVLGVVLLVPASAPTIAQAAALALRAPTAGAPAPLGDGRHLNAAVQGLAFPDWAPRLRSVGLRTDHLSGRLTRTVVYVDARHRRVGYVIVAGLPLADPRGSTHRAGTVAYTVGPGPGPVRVSWRQDGHTCVLVSYDLNAEALVALARGPHAPPSYAG